MKPHRRLPPLLTLACGLLGLSIASPARADDAATTTTTPQVSQCVLKGSQPPSKGTQLYDAASGGRVIAEFSGAMVPLQMSEIPADPTTGRAKLQTSNGTAQVRLEGYVSPTSINVYSAKDV